ncbi:Piwi domain-containing protein [Pyrobaculum aerophilum]|uniref:Piwi domain-containing protein n=1 Tax=Pyrobaculum aerophilum TaxID=13773 RepID=UPI002FD8E909
MILLPRYRLEMPRLLFRGGNPAITPYYGLVKYGPYETPALRFEKVVILSSSEFKTIAMKVKDALKEGIEQLFPGGFARIFGLDVDFELIEVKKYDIYEYKNTAEEFYRVFYNECQDSSTCFPVILINKTPRGLYESLYIELKYKFAIDGIPTQIITYETFSDEQKFQWSIFPLATQIFVKMGGVPFILGDRLNVSNDEGTIFIGVGLSRTRLPDKEVRYIGYALAFEENGKARLLKWSSYIYSRELLAEMLRKLIQDTVDEMLQSYPIDRFQKIHIIIHYSGKNISTLEEEYLRKAASEIKTIRNIYVIPYVVKIQESMYTLYDEENQCPDISSGNPTYLIDSGTAIRLKEDLFLLFTTGCALVEMRGTILKRPNAQGSPSPLIVSIKRLENAKYQLNDIELIKSVFFMTRMNYASINNPISKIPITVKYSKLLAQFTAKLVHANIDSREVNIDSIMPNSLKKVLWFI